MFRKDHKKNSQKHRNFAHRNKTPSILQQYSGSFHIHIPCVCGLSPHTLSPSGPLAKGSGLIPGGPGDWEQTFRRMVGAESPGAAVAGAPPAGERVGGGVPALSLGVGVLGKVGNDPQGGEDGYRPRPGRPGGGGAFLFHPLRVTAPFYHERGGVSRSGGRGGLASWGKWRPPPLSSPN